MSISRTSPGVSPGTQPPLNLAHLVGIYRACKHSLSEHIACGLGIIRNNRGLLTKECCAKHPGAMLVREGRGVSKYAIIVTPKVLFREGIASLLHDTPYKVVVTAAGPAELHQLPFPKGRPLLAIVGVDWQSGTPHETAESVRLLRSSVPDAKVVLVLETNGPIDLQRILALSPDAFIFDVPSRDILLKIMELTFLNQRVFVLPPVSMVEDEVSGPLLSSESSSPTINDRDQLSPRERQVANCLAQGKSNKVIARLCEISEATVKAHLKAILRKTHLQNRTQAAVWAIQHGFGDDATEG
jgi:two-component system nitrate/nitrite response regulator NarL